MATMTSHERILRTYQHREIDRLPILDSPWAGTIRRWHREGMPDDVDWRDFFGADKAAGIHADITPRYERKVLEETDRYRIVTTPWGVTLKELKEEDSTPEFLDYKVCDPEAWAEARERMTPSRDRIDWAYLERNYPRWRAEGQWIQAGFWFGFDVTHSWMAGTETILCALIEDPEWVRDMIATYLDMCIAQFDMVWDAGYRFDCIEWPDDMGYKGTTFFSPALYRELIQPFQRRAVEWAHAKGIYAHLHSCGDIMTLLPDILDTGVDALNPLEVKAGMDAAAIKERYGDRLVLHGGINAALWDKPDLIAAEVDAKLPVLGRNGGYIFATDHSIPNCVSLETFRDIIAKVHAFKPF